MQTVWKKYKHVITIEKKIIYIKIKETYSMWLFNIQQCSFDATKRPAQNRLSMQMIVCKNGDDTTAI